ncbi:MAG TPA: ADP-ribose pyrophosphatase [Clostridiales bacterium]|nr:ADP-ribose pyrophosphatase [Clostridiales bacterium]
MDFTEKKIRSDYKFRGRIMSVRVDDALLPNGRPCKREVCEHVGGVGILPIDEDRTVTLVRQYRYPYETVTLEIPAGKMDQGPEDALECGRRELAEETGLRAEQMIPMGEIWPSPGFMDERLFLYCAKGLTQGETNPDDDEFVEIVRMPFDELCRMIAAGEIHDAKTVAAVGQVLVRGL